MNKQGQYWLGGLLILFSRIPFIFDGYGSEEDAWALRLVAQNIAETGVYEVSRLPGHPLQELVYALIWKTGSVGFNLVTALLSTLGIVFFMRTLDKLDVRQALLSGLFLAAIPIIYINSVNAMDYTWAMAFVLFAFYNIVNRSFVLAGIFLGMATGCRITSAMFGLPFLVLIYQLYPADYLKYCLQFVALSLLTALVLFLPVLNLYGLSFFTYYEHFPIPGFAKNFYKGVLAVWGLPLIFTTAIVFLVRRKYWKVEPTHRSLMHFCWIAAVLITLAFIKVPLKSAFMVPMAPVVVLLLAIIADEKSLRYLTMAAIGSCFLFGLNLDDPLRGSAKSIAGISFRSGGQPIVLDPLQGLLTADRTKKLQRTAYAEMVLEQSRLLPKPCTVIAGWWLADILVLERMKGSADIDWRYYTDEESLKKLKESGTSIYYLPEQEKFNDLRFKGGFTGKYAEAYPY